MYRSFAMAVIVLALVSLPAETSLASPGGRAGKSVDSVTSIAPVPVKSGGTATPAVKKLSPKGGAACFRNCMHGVSGAGWGNFCDSACYGTDWSRRPSEKITRRQGARVMIRVGRNEPHLLS